MDRGKVIERIHEAIDMGVCVDLFMDILELLKEHEAMQVQYSAIGGFRYGACPKCDARVDNLVNPKACGLCGQELKWDARQREGY